MAFARAEHRQRLAFAILPLLQWSISFAAARTIRGVATYDTASYYVVARNFAEGRGLTDTVLWQFLAAPETVRRPAGGYWEIGWPLVLGSLMRVFGSSQRAALFLCAALSGLLPVLTALVAYLAGKRAGPAWLAGLLVCLQARLLATDVTPDATLMYQLATLGGIAALLFARERPSLTRAQLLAVGAALALPMYVRGEGFVVAAVALPLLLFPGGKPSRESLRRTLSVLLGIGALSAPFVLRNLVVFGRLMPAERSLRLWMTAYGDLYRFSSGPSPSSFWAQPYAAILAVRRVALARHVENLTAQVPWPLLPLAALGLLAHARSWRTWALASFVVLSLLAPCLLVPLIASVDRFVMNVLPVVCVAASLGIFAARDRAARLARSRVGSRLAGVLVLAAGAFACTAVFRGQTTVRTYVDRLRLYRDTPAVLSDGATLARLRLSPDDVVLTDDPWRVAAVLDVATVMCPIDGAASVEAVVDRYRPRFVLVSPSSAALRRLVDTPRFHADLVATMRDGSWYALAGRETGP